MIGEGIYVFFTIKLIDLLFSDIQLLKDHEICKSSYLDYTKTMICNDNLVKLIFSFVNCSSRHIIIGFKKRFH